MILFDTDVCVELLRGNKSVIEKRKQTESEIAVSFMTAGELFYGAEKSNNREKNRILVEEFLLSVNILHSDTAIMRRFGEIKAALKSAQILLADADILIAASALEKCKKLITGNSNHFSRINSLTLENWIR
jgi:tRNA(fMet)-specific endonuclease VapC